MASSTTNVGASRAHRRSPRSALQRPRAAQDVPTGRIDIEGKVLTVRVDETPYGDTLKMLVVSDDGWKVWSTVPSGAPSELRGQRIRFRATVKSSPNDPKFGFASRPLYLGS